MPSLSYTFKVTIDPCLTDFTLNQPTTTITYTIGDTDMTDGTYSYTQTPDCKYGEFVELTNLPFFVMHNTATKDFTIFQTENRSLKGTYTVSKRGYILQPDDYVMDTYTTKEVNYDFDIVMQDPCENTVLDAFLVNNMQTSVHGVADL